MRVASPCFGCGGRKPHCHSGCERYQAFLPQFRDGEKEKQRNYELNKYVMDAKERSRRRKR